MTQIEDTLKERGGNYGSFRGHAGATQGIKGVMGEALTKNERFTSLPYDDRLVVLEALDMIAHKLGRIVNGDPLFKDSWDDIAGYALLVNRHTGDEK